MNKLLIKTFAKKVIEFLKYSLGYKAREYAYVRVHQADKNNIYDDKFQR